jgi:hypothetical protein
MATQSYSTPGSYNFTLPVSTGITIRIAGAAGGTGGTDGGPPGIVGGSGGRGRYGVFTLPDYSYGDFTFVVGGAGGNGGNSGTVAFNGGSGGSSATSAGGGGQEDSPSGSSGGGAGGGGASSVSFDGSLLVIAGAGGGGGGGTNGATSNLGSYRTDGEDAGTFSSDTTSPSDTPDATGSTAGTGGDGGGAGGGGGGYVAGARGTFPGNDGVHPAEGGFGGGSIYRSDRLTLSSQSTYTVSLDGYIEIEYTAVSFDTSAATVSKAGPYYTTAGTEMKFSALRRDFRAQQPKTTSGGSETFLTDNAPISASELLRNTNVNETNPIVPQCQDNIQISSSSNWKISQFRNSIKYFYLTQDSSKTTLNYILHGQPWQNNLPLNIVKTFFLEGTCGSISSTDAALQLDADVYNLNLIITGSVLGAGGSSGAKGDKNQSDGTVTADAGNGGNGGNAIYIDTNGTGTVTVKTSGASAQVYGGGGGGAGGGYGGNGSDGSYTTYYSFYTSVGGPGGTYGGSYDSRCRQSCQRAGAQWVNNCYKHTSQRGQTCGGNSGFYGNGVCYSDDASNYADVTACRRTNTGSTTNASYGGHGGDGTAGGVGQGYLQTKTNAANAPTLGQTNGPTSRSHSSAGNAGRGGRGGNGGDWGESGDNANAENGYPGYRSNGSTVNQNGSSVGSPGAAGAAVSGSGYVIDTSGVSSAYKGSN